MVNGEIIMGGSGSTGSSLLKNILGRHSQIFASQETSIFAKSEVYKDWAGAKKRILGKRWWGLANLGFHRYDRIDFYPEEVLFSKETLKDIIDNSETLPEFATALFSKACINKGANRWLEKTPANSFCFLPFKHVFPKAKIIHIVRNPLDTIASLIARGQNPYYATAIYLCNTAAGIEARSLGQDYLEIKYEDLVQTPRKSIATLCAFLEIQVEENMFEPRQESHSNGTTLPGWTYDETEKIQSGSVSRFTKLDKVGQDEILHAIHNIYINEKGQAAFSTNITDVISIAQYLKYVIPPCPRDEELRRKLLRFRKKDKRSRLKYEIKRPIMQYPVSIKNN